MKYLVLECHPGYAVVLSEDGRFLKAANLRYEVGQTVSDIIEVNLPHSQPVKKHNRRWISSLSAMAASLVLFFSAFLYGQMPYASVYMTINPEVRIDVNRSDRVVNVDGMNRDGVVLLTDYDPGRKTLDTVMDELVDRAIHMGYLHEGGKIMLNLDGSEDWVKSHGTQLNQHLNQHLTDKISVSIDVAQKPPAQSAPTLPQSPIVIPVGPDHYGDSDYGEDEESDYGEADSDYGVFDSGYGQSDYDDLDSGYGQSDYDDRDSGNDQSDYDSPDSEYTPSDGGDYDGDEPEDDGQTDYDDWSEIGGASEYQEPSDYGGTAEDASSDYDPVGEDFSDYEDANSDYDD